MFGTVDFERTDRFGVTSWHTNSKGYMNPLRTLLAASNRCTWRIWPPTTAMSIGTGLPTQKKARTALDARAHFEWKANQYSEMYRQADSCVVRMANAADPSSSTSYNPNMRIKCFRSNGMESANIQTLWTIDGYNVIPAGKTKSCSSLRRRSPQPLRSPR